MRLPRMRVRTLMILVLLVGCGLGWVMHSARVQREAVEAIKRAGGHVYYAWEFGNANHIASAAPPGPRWLRVYLGPEFLDDVTAVALIGPEAGDAAILHVGRLRRLEHLVLRNTSISDSGMTSLAGLTQLEELELNGTRVSDAGLKHLVGLTRLESLDLANTPVSDAGLVHLAGLMRLERLHLGGTRVSEAGLVHLAGLTRLKKLFVYDLRFTDDGIKAIQKALPGVEIVGSQGPVYPPVRSIGTPSK